MSAGHVGHLLVALEEFSVLPTWLAALRQQGRLAPALRRSVPALASGELDLLDAALVRIRAKGTQWKVQGEAVVAGPDGATRQLRLEGQVLPPGLPAPTTAADAGVFGEPGWQGYLDELRLRLRFEAQDPALPALATLLDPDEAAHLLQTCLRDSGMPDATVLGCVPDPVRYKPGSRCTVVYRMHYAPVPGRSFPDPLVAKTHHGAKGQVAYQGMCALWARPVARGDVVTLAEPLAYLPADRILVQGPVPGDSTLADLLRAALSGPPPALARLRFFLRRTAAGLAAVHTSGAAVGAPATWEQELAETEELTDRLTPTLPDLSPAVALFLARLRDDAGAVPADPPVSVHGTFRPAQVLLDGDRIGFIDFDGFGLAEPASDLARFTVNLRDLGIGDLARSGTALEGAELHARLALLDDLVAEFVAAYRRAAPVSPDRVRLWERTYLFSELVQTWSKVLVDKIPQRLALVRHSLAPVITAH